jgi:hypothetical protein
VATCNFPARLLHHCNYLTLPPVKTLLRSYYFYYRRWAWEVKLCDGFLGFELDSLLLHLWLYYSS